VLSRCDRIIARERLSYDFAQRMGLENVDLGVDMAFALYQGPPAYRGGDGVAITPRELPYEPPQALQRYEQAVVQTVHMLVDEWGEHCYLAPQVDEDLALCGRLAARIDRPGYVEIADEVSHMPLRGLMEWYGQRRLVIGTRIHSVILAGLMHTPSVILECDPPKMVGISEQMGLDRWRVPAAGPEVARLPQLVREALNAAEETEAGFEERLSQLAKTAREQTASAVQRACQSGSLPDSLEVAR
jgi:polysaccharide pyruvyl transferase WcaK-like protein